ncbi:MAG TPA: cytochrome c [Hyphomonadaceae bacterium]|jgi:mono/diheme cytochrome c family protein
MRRLVIAVLVLAAPACATLEPAITDREALARGQEGFSAYCASCHDPPKLGAPNRFALSRMTPSYIVSQLDAGKMKMMALDLPPQQVREIAAYLGNKP